MPVGGDKAEKTGTHIYLFAVSPCGECSVIYTGTSIDTATGAG